MVYQAREVETKRYREDIGRYFEDFEVGDVYGHRPGRTITESDNIWFTLLTMNTHLLHFDREYAAKSEFGRPLLEQLPHPGHRGGDERERSQPEGDREPGLDRHQAHRSRLQRGHGLRGERGAPSAPGTPEDTAVAFSASVDSFLTQVIRCPPNGVNSKGGRPGHSRSPLSKGCGVCHRAASSRRALASEPLIPLGPVRVLRRSVFRPVRILTM